MILLMLSRTPPRLAGLVTQWLIEVREGVYVGNVSEAIRSSIWQRVIADVGKGHSMMVWPGLGLNMTIHNHEWDIVEFDGLPLVRKPTQDEGLKRQALEMFTELSATEINKVMARWLAKNHPKARTPRKRTTPARVVSIRYREGDGCEGPK